MFISIEEIEQINQRIEEINSIDLKNIVFTVNGKAVISYTDKDVEDWKFTGLSNIAFTEFLMCKEKQRC